MRSFIMVGLPTHLVQELDVVTVLFILSRDRRFDISTGHFNHMHGTASNRSPGVPLLEKQHGNSSYFSYNQSEKTVLIRQP